MEYSKTFGNKVVFYIQDKAEKSERERAFKNLALLSNREEMTTFLFEKKLECHSLHSKAFHVHNGSTGLHVLFLG